MLPILGIFLILLLLLTFASPRSVIPLHYNVSSSHLQARDMKIELELGTKKVNIGSTWENELRDEIVKALRHACPHSGQRDCGSKTKAHGSFKVYAWKGKNRPVSQDDLENLVVTVDSARWNNNKEIYDVLIDAVAGTAPLAARGNCHRFQYIAHDGTLYDYNFCNTVSRIAVKVPGHGNNHMDVSLKSSSATGDMDCWKSRDTAAECLRELQPRIEKAMGIEDQDRDIYVDPQCVD